MSDTLTFQRDGSDHVAVISPIPARPVTDALTVEHHGRRYAISIALGDIPGYPGVGFIARPVQADG